MLPRSRKDGLVFTRLTDETLVYDLERHRALCLNRLAAAVWHRCDGQSSISKLASDVSGELSAVVDADMIWYALKRLARTHLLAEEIPPAAFRRALTRRDALRRLAAAGVVSVGLPTVLSVVAPTALQAQASCADEGEVCNVIPCCPGFVCVAFQCQLP